MNDAAKPLPKAVVLGGKRGLLGQALVEVLRNAGWSVAAHCREDCDVMDVTALKHYLGEQAPDYVYNTIAYTQVDKAEDEPHEAQRLRHEGLDRWLEVGEA
jgi:dTDP-4-dehydrorhamnose reductase